MPSRVKTTVGETVRTILTADSATTAIVAGRIYPNELPQGVNLPAVVYTTISDTPELTFSTAIANTFKAARVQLDCYARPTTAGGGAYAQAHALARAVASALGDVADSDLQINLEAERDLYDNVTQYHRVSLDFTVWR